MLGTVEGGTSVMSMAGSLACRGADVGDVVEGLAATRAFFGPRAAGWEDRFPDDGPSYVSAVRELGVGDGATVLDCGCGTGRALAPLRAAVGPAGTVVGVDAVDEMLAEAVRRDRTRAALLLSADACRLPLRTASVDAVLTAGLLPHLADPVAGLAELARVARDRGGLAVFHPVGRTALAARHGGTPSADDVLAPGRLSPLLERTGWLVEAIDDGDGRYLALAVRSPRS